MQSANPQSVQNYRAAREISLVQGENFPNPITKFSDAKFPDFVANFVEKNGFTDPTAIQAQVHSVLTFQSGENSHLMAHE